MSPTRRRGADRFDKLDRRKTSKMVAAAAVLTVVSGTVVLTRAAASSESVSAATRRPAACAPGTVQAGGTGTQKQPSQPLSPGARWLKKRGEMTDRHGVHQIWGDGQVPSAGTASGSTPVKAGCAGSGTGAPTGTAGAGTPPRAGTGKAGRGTAPTTRTPHPRASHPP